MDYTFHFQIPTYSDCSHHHTLGLLIKLIWVWKDKSLEKRKFKGKRSDFCYRCYLVLLILSTFSQFLFLVLNFRNDIKLIMRWIRSRRKVGILHFVSRICQKHSWWYLPITSIKYNSTENTVYLLSFAL